MKPYIEPDMAAELATSNMFSNDAFNHNLKSMPLLLTAVTQVMNQATWNSGEPMPPDFAEL